ncbi:MAG: hypothetical protein V4622_00135 [Bacteroidota bacterium]
MKIVKLFFLLLTFNISYSQIELTEKIEDQQELAGVIEINENEFFAFQYVGEHKEYKEFSIAKYVNNKKQASFEFGKKLKLDKSEFSVEKIFLFNGFPTIVFVEKEQKTMNIKIQQFDLNCNLLGDFKLLDSYEKKGITAYHLFKIEVSQNEKHLLVKSRIFDDPKLDIKAKNVYKVYNANLEIVSEQNVLVNEKNLFPSKLFLSNTGEIYATNYTYKSVNPGFKNSFYTDQFGHQRPLSFNSLIKRTFFRIEDNYTEEFSSFDDFKECTIADDFLYFQSKFENNNLNASVSLYQDKSTEYGFKGLFVSLVDENNFTLKSSFYCEFTKEFIISTFNEKQLKWYDKGDQELSLKFDYNLIDFKMLDDANFIAILESNTEIINEGKAVGHESEEIFILKINSKGEIVWFKKIDKLQKGNKKEFDLISYHILFSKNKIKLLFNDNVLNYNKAGKFELVENKIEKCKFNVAQNTIAFVNLDIETGELTRESLNNIELKECLLAPCLNNRLISLSNISQIMTKDSRQFVILK